MEEDIGEGSVFNNEPRDTQPSVEGLSKRALALWERIQAPWNWYRPRRSTPKAMQELVDAGLVRIAGRVNVVTACYVPVGFQPHKLEVYPGVFAHLSAQLDEAASPQPTDDVERARELALEALEEPFYPDERRNPEVNKAQIDRVAALFLTTLTAARREGAELRALDEAMSDSHPRSPDSAR